MENDDGFIMVGKKKKHNNKNKIAIKKEKDKNSGFIYKSYKTKKTSTVANKISTETIQNQIEEKRTKLLESKFYVQLLFELQIIKPLIQYYRSKEKPEYFNVDIVSYGIGNFMKSRISQFQFALCILLKANLKLNGKVYFYDPIFTEVEKEVINNYGFEVIEDNEHGKRNINKMTLFYMPHCNYNLYNNVLGTNWELGKLSKLILIGNDFSIYDENMVSSKLESEAPFLKAILPLTKKVAFPELFESNDIFNNTSIHFFPKSNLLEQSEQFWNMKDKYKLEEFKEISN
ncbi:hypothetical protein BCR36DRAFT_326860 [Piromyces finnis]|uniref:SRR1-like domain-containing protein n=1 Tax=Piromyces finnis TaxID=1754191 RepID=A0A1Y1V930_9FUNG|nr:hypothetical protein BCR36DRAFT_326860 [Piromyces finnis]|eukprot:ORX50287.1 hypothetical protein BCR36DRAFT_326860 [Piromyces finnis]